jgi:rhodanese-related sulfurtransferase
VRLRGYQERALSEAISALTGGGGFLLTLEMRTGKTVVSLRCYKHFGLDIPLLIVCPKVALPVWRKELKKEKITEYTLVHYEGLTLNKKRWYKWRNEHRGFFMIVDESHFIKNRGSTRSTVIRTVAKKSKYRLALTGTPLSQGIQDAWAQCNYLDPSILGPWDDHWEGGLDGSLIPGFESTYLRYGGFRNHQVVGYRNEEQFSEIFNRYQFRITLKEAKREGGKGALVLRVRKRYFDLNPVARGIYDALQEELEAVVNRKKIKVKNVLSCVAKLQQIAGGHFIEKYWKGIYSKRGKPIEGKVIHEIEGPGKLDLLKEQIRDIKGKFIVICRFIHELEKVAGWLTSQGYDTAIVRGGMPYDGKFNSDAICMQVQSGMAVDMSKADTVIFYSLDYSYINFEQSRFRILNYDKNFGKYTFLLANDTVDEIVYAAVRSKKRVADLIIDKYRIRRQRGRKLAKANRQSQGQTQSPIIVNLRGKYNGKANQEGRQGIIVQAGEDVQEGIQQRRRPWTAGSARWLRLRRNARRRG